MNTNKTTQTTTDPTKQETDGGPGQPGDNGGDTDVITAQIKVHVDAIAALAQVPANYDPSDKLPKVSNPYGKQLASYTIGSALTVEGCPEAFTRYPGLDERLRNNSNNYIVQNNAKGLVSNLLRGLSFTLGQETQQQVSDVALTINIRDATMNNRGGDPQVQAKMDRSSTLLQQLRAGRASSSSTKAKGKKAADAALLNANTTIGKQGVQIKYLNGQELTPDDVIVQPVAPAARSARRGKKPAAASTPATATTTPAAASPTASARRPTRTTTRGPRRP